LIVDGGWTALPHPPSTIHARRFYAQRRGYTLFEAMLASVVLAIAVVGISSVLAASYQQSSIRGNTSTALSLARQLMEEIASMPLTAPVPPDQPGWSQGQKDRSQYDTVDDYDGYTDQSSGITTPDGTVIDMGAGGSYTRSVKVTFNARPSGVPATAPASDFDLVTVTVTMPHGQQVSVSQLMTKATLVRAN
jgi:type II secretory pathway pseudopilin PulG